MNDELLIKYLLEETSEQENSKVKQWLEADPDHQKQYEQMRWLWESSKTALHNSKVDENLAWEKFKARRGSAPKTIQFPLWLRGVAAVFAVLSIGWIALSFMPHSGKAYFTEVLLEAGGTSQKELLLDGTVVTLNRNSKLSYSQKLFGGERQAHLLEGEAYFEVKRNENKPFSIQVEDVTIRVLGTSFNVEKGKTHTAVMLDKGSVAVALGGQSLVLEPGEKASVDKERRSLVKSRTENQLYRYYLNNKFEAQQLPLYQIVEALNNAYDANIAIASEALGQKRLTTTLEYGSLDQNLEVIKETLGISISGEGRERVLY